MHFLKKKKNKILTLVLVASLATSLSFGSVIYYSFFDANISFDTSSNGITDAELAPINNATNDAVVSNRDNKLKPSPKEEIRKTDSTEKLVIPTVRKEDKVTDSAKPEFKPEIRKPDSSNIKPTVTRSTRTIVISGVEVEAEVEGPPGFHVHKEDVARGIANPKKPYQNQSVGKILNVKVTDDLRRGVIRESLTGGEGYDKGAALFNNSLFNVFDKDLSNTNDVEKTLEELEAVANQNASVYENTLERYKRLLDSDNVVNFLKEGAKEKYEELKPKFKTNKQRYIWLIANLDKNKFTKIASTSEKYLAQGLTISPRSAFINEKGEIDSNGWGPPNEFNTVTSRIQNDNSNYRTFSYDTPYNRPSDSVESGNYPGWTKKDVTSTYTKDYGFEEGKGITISELTRDKPTNAKDKINKGLVLEIDASKDYAYGKTKELIKKIKEKNQKITSYRIKNMGEKDSAQNFIEILSELPEHIPQLELFFSDKATNTASLIALENKKIDDLSLYTNGNSLRRSWSYNPLALKNTAWINTIDYNVSAEYSKHETISTRITFNTLAFDQKDYEKDGDYSRINDGLRMVYYARNNEPFFQGGFGPGLSPDKSLGENSYPTGLDFTRIPKIRSLRGLRFDDEYNSSNRSRKITELTLYNTGSAFDISVEELNNANLEHLSTGEGNPEKPKIYFSNGNETTSIKITGQGKISDRGREYLSKYFEYGESFKGRPHIVEVESGATELKKQLENWGFNVSESTGRSFT
ncbi:putative immunoglobulin-blocking virulence protein [Mycoplasma mycoides]|uniref:putative immunoglobulin-blocking virulence protein n=1 Tax=Mycoplasma mycoides TaxID=2102 RepID=UPI00273474B9|nr:putative immunoglobulin-blocking virulence protein [Mycoplasma mycoides]MDP4040422.1 putative immunoglobulin-blocking virulence protein [Mycoplasma mycoides]MDP4041548.1 putative immunoglobulin-blocking virulence protein [Mycoplasma mycoides]MDP4042253.1 putative immunoglobulin-blocking virulence protein [Mycoplasma mycoides]MDP4043655.1 putative immunoglobulin-blocking virulence protein [Mycoplasma mycoides]MDP4044509.1 putative immunoglobulin-blocking virulence protein [Mycoplasma mycoide